MDCPEFEDSPELEAQFAKVDAALTAAFSDLTVPPHFQARVHARLRPVPVIPAVFDLLGAISIVAILAILAFKFVPDVQVDVQTLVAIGSVCALLSVLVAYRTVAKA